MTKKTPMETVQLTGRKQRLALVESKSCGGAYKQDRFRKLKRRENTKGLSRERVNNRHKTKVKKKKKENTKKKAAAKKKKRSLRSAADTIFFPLSVYCSFSNERRWHTNRKSITSLKMREKGRGRT